MTKIGEVEKASWYEFEDGVFSIHTAEYSDHNVTFRCDCKTWPSSLVEPGYSFLRVATQSEIEEFLFNLDVQLVKIMVV